MYRSKKTLKLHLTGLCQWNSPVTEGFPSQRASNAENVSIWWYHHVMILHHASDTVDSIYNIQWKSGNREVLFEMINEVHFHYNDGIMNAMASQITSLTIVYSSVYSGADPRKHQSSASLAFVRGIHRWPVNSPHKGPVTRNIFHLMTSSCHSLHPLTIFNHRV